MSRRRTQDLSYPLITTRMHTRVLSINGRELESGEWLYLCVYGNYGEKLATSNDRSLRYDTSPTDDERWEERHLAHLTARDYIQDLESGPGKDAMENYLRVALPEHHHAEHH